MTSPALRPCRWAWQASLIALLAASAARPAAAQDAGRFTAHGKFEPTWESLAKNYRVPAWYQDAKFGIFIHWGVYSVPAFGNEWYPRNMYLKDSPEYKHHLATFGPQERFGYKDFIPLFKAERFDPAAWAKLFKDAGAKYVVPVAEHHDGFQMYESALSEWNAAKMGPKRDIVGELEKAVRKEGLHFGVSSHRAEHWWFMNGGKVFPSDVQDPRYAAFYGPAMQEKDTPTPEYLDDWLARTCELVDKYHPDVVWFDWWINTPVFKPYLARFGAYYYNRSSARGPVGVINYKFTAYPDTGAVLDIERGLLGATRKQFWQTDTSVSNRSWGYIKGDDFKPAGELVDELVDIVSKNGCLLLNVGPASDGAIPDQAQAILLDMGRWLKVNGEAIYGSRPFKVFGEGPTRPKAGSFGEGSTKYTGQDIRFTRKGNTLYAVCMEWPGDQVTIRSLGTQTGLASGQVKSVSLLGSRAVLKWTQSAEGLTVTLPAERPCDHACALKITGLRGLAWEPTVGPRPDGTLVLGANEAELHGDGIGVESQAPEGNLGFWDKPDAWASWEMRVPRAGTYDVSLKTAATSAQALYTVEVAGQKLEGQAPGTGGFAAFQTTRVGTVTFRKPGRYVLSVRPRNGSAWKAMNLASVTLVPVR